MIAVGIGLTLTGLLAVASAPVAAQAGNNSTETARNASVEISAGSDSREDCTERVSDSLSICSKTYQDGTATLILESEQANRLTLTDAGAFIEGGEVGRDRVTVYEGRNTVSIPATEVHGFAGVAIDTGEVLYAVKIQSISPSGPPISYGNAQALVALTAVGAAAFTYRVVRRKREEESPEWEKIL